MKKSENALARLRGKLVLVGFGSIGQACLGVLMERLGLRADRVCIVKPSPDEGGVAEELGVEIHLHRLDEGNYKTVLEPLLETGDFLLNLSVDVSSLALIRLCRERGVLYLDTCNEPWPGRYDDPSLPLSRRSNYSLREDVLASRLDKRQGPTAVITQGANPGLVSALVKQALLDVAQADDKLPQTLPSCFEEWAALAQTLAIRTIHVAERDTQAARQRKQRGAFVNTWSVDGFIHAGLQPAGLRCPRDWAA